MKKNKLIVIILICLMTPSLPAVVRAEQIFGTKWQSYDGDIVAFYDGSLWMWNARQSFHTARRASCRTAGDRIALWKDIAGPVYGLYAMNWNSKTMCGIIVFEFFPLVYRTDLYHLADDEWSPENE